MAGPQKDDWFAANAPVKGAPPMPPSGDWFAAASTNPSQLTAEQRGVLARVASPTQFEYERNPANQPGFLPSMVSTIAGGIEHAPHVLGQVFDPQQARQAMEDEWRAMDTREHQGRSLSYRMLAPAVSGLIDVPGMEHQSDIGSKSGVMGAAVGSAVPYVAPLALEGAAHIPRSGGTPATPVMAADRVMQAIEPAVDAQEMPFVRERVGQHLDSVVRHAKENSLPLNSVQDLANAAKQSAQADPYRKAFIEPFEQVEVSSSEVPGYQGATINRGLSTLKQLDDRLVEINATLSPKYRSGGRGSTQAQAAIDATQAAAMQAEAVSIRHAIADAVGRRLGIDPQIVYQGRARYGQLSDLAEDMQYAASSMTKQAAQKANTPLRVGDVAKKPLEIPVNPRNWKRNIPDRVIADTFKNYTPAPAPPALMTNPPITPVPRTPLWEGVEPPPRPSASLSSPEDIAANESRIQQGMKQRRTAIEQRQAQERHNAANRNAMWRKDIKRAGWQERENR